MLSARLIVFLVAALHSGVLAWAQNEAAPAVLPADSDQPEIAATRPDTNPSPIPKPALPTVLSPMRRGDILMARKRYREAIETYQEGIRSAAVLYNKMGIAYHQLMDFKTALEHYRKALQVDSSYSEAINNIGTVYYAQKNHKRAIKQYKEALKHAPMSASIYSNLGTAYFARKKYKDASAAYQRALEIDPDVFEHRNTAGSLLQERSVQERAKFHYYLAKTYAKAGMVDRALSYIRKALEEGFRDKDRFRKDAEFQALQELEEFQALMEMEPRVL